MEKELQELQKQEWYTQGFAGRPAFLVSCCSIEPMQRACGFFYNAIPMAYKEDFCNFSYPMRDLETHAETIIKKLEQNPKYLEQLREKYNNEVASAESFFNNIETNCAKMADEEIFKALPEFYKKMDVTNGIAHMIEGISLRLEKEIYAALGKTQSGKELNADFSIIATPLAQSFLSKKEGLLWEIKHAQEKKKLELVRKYIKEFFWLKSNFTGSTKLEEKEVLDEAEKLEKFEKPDFSKLKEKKETLFKKYSLGEKEKAFLDFASLLTEWQDDRKKNMFRGVFALDAVLDELSKRYNIERKFLQYLLPFEIESAIKNKTVEKIATERIQGCVFVRYLNKTSFFGEADYNEFMKKEQPEKTTEILTGMSASLGTATGPVKIVNTMESLAKVQKGDILVASMTRPEYVPAMKKAVAIVTDEGGITCHAAIISRELGIPCVVGTKIATKVLKDGDIVQVKANHGSVVKLR
jgi:phosphohistidine swiveling domain-containing protein